MEANRVRPQKHQAARRGAGRAVVGSAPLLVARGPRSLLSRILSSTRLCPELSEFKETILSLDRVHVRIRSAIELNRLH